MKLTKMFSAAALLAALTLPCGQALAAENVIVTGSTTVLPVMQKAGEAFMASHPDVSLVISGGGSGNGIKALLEGLCQVAMSSRDIKKSEIDDAAKRGVTPVRTAIAIDALAPVVNPANPVSTLSLDQLKKIYAGEITNWKDLGGNNAPIVAISRDTSSGTYETWEEIVMKGSKVSPRALLQASNGAVSQIVSKNKNAIGYVGMGYLNREMKSLKIGAVAPSAKTALDKEWPISRELYIFTNGQPQGRVKELADFLLAPDKGQKAVSEIGFVPLPVRK